MMYQCNLGAEWMKYDIKLAFPLLLGHPEDSKLLGFSFQILF